MWKPRITKWYNVDTKAYELIYSEGKVRYEDIMAESESITNKAFKMITIAGALGSLCLSLALRNDVPEAVSVLLMLALLIVFIILIKLIFPKKIRNRGVAPKFSFVNNLDDPDDKGYQEQLVLYNLICMLQDDITHMTEKNKGRARWYIAAIIALSTLAVSTIAGSVYYLAPLVDKLPSSV